ncbi:DUF6802 family protein [Actinocrispum wychmicini]|uniref:DUF6802 domain-containing protein n=1 Tax=Actinocrispum wychmicini TaxID=1213861 RepID=A0A4R2K4P5_9PSEU|nr:DUF6802 family protein [Actinocrispum wychmicini]TCO64758.1 hypothetical protein EV192_101540 [Actinocrispum wychmicini]
MYDDTTDHSSTTHGGTDELTVNVDGEQYEVQENYDLDHDGHNDTAVVQTDDGHQVAFSDTDHDGTADVAVEVDDHGNVVGAARYDEQSGEWVAVDPKTGQEAGGGSTGGHSTGASDHHSTGGTGTGSHSSGSGSSSGGDGEDITVDVPGQSQDVDAGHATLDINHDGVKDTVVEKESDGTTIAFTDVDGDGKADVVTIIDPTGDVTIGQHTGEDEWTDVEHGHVDSRGNYTPDSTSSRR